MVDAFAGACTCYLLPTKIAENIKIFENAPLGQNGHFLYLDIGTKNQNFLENFDVWSSIPIN